MTALRGIVAWDKGCRLELQRAGIKRAKLADPSKYAGGKKRVPAGAIRALAADGMTPTQIHRILKIDRSTVYAYLPSDYRVPVKPKRTPREPLNPATIQALLRSGLGPTRIAQSLSCSRSSIYRLAGYADGRWR